jgi:hypothetical protein
MSDADCGLDPEIPQVILSRGILIRLREGSGGASTLKSRHLLSHGMDMLNMGGEHKLLPLVSQLTQILVEI